MTTHTENHQPDSELTLRDRTSSPLSVRAIALSLTKQDDQLIECRLTFSVNPEFYQRIDTQSLFNLKPELRGPFTSEFLPSPDIKIEISLKPDLLPHLLEHAANPNEAANYLLNISAEKPDDSLLRRKIGWVYPSSSDRNQAKLVTPPSGIILIPLLSRMVELIAKKLEMRSPISSKSERKQISRR